jgi:hypothetical protein
MTRTRMTRTVIKPELHAHYTDDGFRAMIMMLMSFSASNLNLPVNKTLQLSRYPGRYN